MFKFHNKATEETFRKVCGIKAKLNEIEFAGNTIKKNLMELAKIEGIDKEEINKKIPKAVKMYDKIFLSTIPKSTKKFLLPGALNLIKELSRDKN